MAGAPALNSYRRGFLRLPFSAVVSVILSALLLVIPVTGDLGTPSQGMAPRSGMLIPLYIYPVAGAWDPLYLAVQNHPSVDFIIVVNPANGPGSGALPDANYTREITRLNTFSNVRTIGYVAVDYGRKPIDDVFADIAKYASWTSQNQRLSMQGVFLDESPQLADTHNTTYLQQIRNNVKSTRQLSGGLLVMNPGQIPDAQILATADRTVVFEERYQTYINLQAAKQLAALPDRNALVCLMHSVPSEMPGPQLKAIVGELRELSGSVFLTDLSDLYYQRFSGRFQEFIDAMA